MGVKGRFEKLGIKQVVRREWMDRAVMLLLSNRDEAAIRAELGRYLATRMPSGGEGRRGAYAYPMVVGILSAWFAPDVDLLPLRNRALALARERGAAEWLPLHWGVLSAAYPFWFAVAGYAGRLLRLQGEVSQVQVSLRVKGVYGDRCTVARNVQYALRSLVAWGVLRDAEVRGCYVAGVRTPVTDARVGAFLVEAALCAGRDGGRDEGRALADPGLFPFELPLLSFSSVGVSGR